MFWTQNFFGPKICWVKKNGTNLDLIFVLDPNSFWDGKLFWTQNLLGKNVFWQKVFLRYLVNVIFCKSVTHNFLHPKFVHTQLFFWKQKIFGPKMLGPKKFSAKQNLGQKMSVLKHFWSKNSRSKIFCLRKLSVQNSLGFKHFGSRKSLGRAPKNMCPKKFYIQEILVSKNIMRLLISTLSCCIM